MKIYIDYNFINWNEYIDIERGNKFKANKIKQQEKDIVRFYSINKKYTGKYPVEIIINKHFKNKRQDLDNVRIKGILDGLVVSGVIENDNLTKIQKITYITVFDDKDGIEIEIKELGE